MRAIVTDESIAPLLGITYHAMRRVFNTFSILSLAACVGVAILWAECTRWHSYSAIIQGYWQSEDHLTRRGIVVTSIEGHVYFEVCGRVYDKTHFFPDIKTFVARRWVELTSNRRGAYVFDPITEHHYGRPAFDASAVWTGYSDLPWSARYVVIPHWFLLMVFSILPALRLGWGCVEYKWKKGAVAGCCVKCGYDLRASPDGCPECGAPPEAPPETSPEVAPEAAPEGAGGLPSRPL